MTKKEEELLIEELTKIKLKGLRKTLGPIAYSKINLLDTIKEDFNDGYYIEAYAIAEQYIGDLLKHIFSDGTKSYWKKTLSTESMLRAATSFDIITTNYLEEYLGFKCIRNELIHKAINNPSQYNKIQSKEIIYKRLISAINITENLFEKIINEKIRRSTTKILNIKNKGDLKNLHNSLYANIEFYIAFKIRLLIQRDKMSIDETKEYINRWSKNLLSGF